MAAFLAGTDIDGLQAVLEEVLLQVEEGGAQPDAAGEITVDKNNLFRRTWLSPTNNHLIIYYSASRFHSIWPERTAQDNQSVFKAYIYRISTGHR